MAEMLDQWMKSGGYLPPVMRDFHDQKDLFKALHDLVAVENHGYAGKVDWMTGQCYVVDIFLWWMAKHGYTLQRSRAGLPFRDLECDVRDANSRRTASFAALFSHPAGDANG